MTIVMLRKGNTGDGRVPGEDVRDGEKNLNVNVLNPKKQCDPTVRNRTNRQEKKSNTKSGAKSNAKSGLL